jgi:hypothetical protein
MANRGERRYHDPCLAKLQPRNEQQNADAGHEPRETDRHRSHGDFDPALGSRDRDREDR